MRVLVHSKSAEIARPGNRLSSQLMGPLGLCIYLDRTSEEEKLKRAHIIARRREFSIPGYKTFADVGLDGAWVTPIQIRSKSKTGPVLVGHYWLDAPSVEPNRTVLEKKGYLPDIPFNKVLTLALGQAGLTRKQIYITQAFHLLPDGPSPSIRSRHIDASFARITRFEVDGRAVIALGTVAAGACRRADVKHIPCISPSFRGKSYAYRAEELAKALKEALAQINTI